MVAQNLLDTIAGLPIQKRLELLDRLRESVRNDPAVEPISEEHRRILDERLDDFERDLTQGPSWADVEERIRARLKR